MGRSSGPKRVLQIPALAGRLIWLLTRLWCSPGRGVCPAFTYNCGGRTKQCRPELALSVMLMSMLIWTRTRAK